MRAFVIFALIAVAAARPDIGLQLQQQGGHQGHQGHQGHNGYNYGQTGSGYNSGGNSFGGGSSAGGSSGGGSSGGGSNFGGSSGGGSNFGGSSGGGGNFGSSGGGGNFGSSGGGGAFGGSSGGGGGGADGGVTRGDSQIIDISNGGSSANIVYKPVVKQGPPQITKHFYVHEAPEEAQNVEYRDKEINVRPQKHYKIIFIKAPSASSSVAGGSAAIFPQNEEKTIVYVLSKKPEGSEQDFEVPQPPAPVTTKPEVFFVKYKTQQEADGAISTIQNSFKEGGAGYNNPAGFAQSLGASSGSASASSFGGRTDAGPAPSSFGSNSGSNSGSFGGSSGGSSYDGSNSGSFGGQTGSYSGGNDGSLRTGSGFAASENVFTSQHMIEIPEADSQFKSVYLPPGK